MRCTAWWWKEFTSTSSGPSRAATRVPGTARTRWRTAPEWDEAPGTSAWMSWWSEPPEATVSSWTPRQTPSTGSPSASTARAMSTSMRSRGGFTVSSFGCGVSP